MTLSSHPGLLLVISGPSGVGKTTLVRAVRARLGADFSVSATTRKPTAQDTAGVDYDFVDQAAFQRMIDDHAFIEYAQVFGRSWYGTPREPVERSLRMGRTMILDIDVQGALQVRRVFPQALMIFVEPPTEEELLRRLHSRGRDDEEAILRRFAEAKREMTVARASQAYDAFVINDALSAAEEEICRIVSARLGRAPASAGTTER